MPTAIGPYGGKRETGVRTGGPARGGGGKPPPYGVSNADQRDDMGGGAAQKGSADQWDDVGGGVRGGRGFA